MSELSPEARAVLSLAADADDPAPEDRARVERALGVALGVGAVAHGVGAVAHAGAASGASSALAPAALAPKVTAALALKLGLGALCLTAGVGATWSVLRPAPAPRAAHTAAAPQRTAAHPVPRARPSPAAPSLVPSATPALVEAPAPAPVATALAAPAPTVSTPRSTPHLHTPEADALAAEGALLREAHRSLAQGQPAQALERLREHRERYPRGALRPEAQAQEVLVLCALGRRDDALGLAARFLRAHPRSPLAPRVERACALPAAPPRP